MPKGEKSSSRFYEGFAWVGHKLMFLLPLPFLACVLYLSIRETIYLLLIELYLCVVLCGCVKILRTRRPIVILVGWSIMAIWYSYYWVDHQYLIWSQYGYMVISLFLRQLLWIRDGMISLKLPMSQIVLIISILSSMPIWSCSLPYYGKAISMCEYLYSKFKLIICTHAGGAFYI
jgi:hypothetical protein